jgi:hypothetical protein
MTTSAGDDVAAPPGHDAEPVDEQARRKNVGPIRSADDLARDGIFDTNEELDAFLAHLSAIRHADSFRSIWRSNGQ